VADPGARRDASPHVHLPPPAATLLGLTGKQAVKPAKPIDGPRRGDARRGAVPRALACATLRHRPAAPSSPRPADEPAGAARPALVLFPIRSHMPVADLGARAAPPRRRDPAPPNSNAVGFDPKGVERRRRRPNGAEPAPGRPPGPMERRRAPARPQRLRHRPARGMAARRPRAAIRRLGTPGRHAAERRHARRPIFPVSSAQDPPSHRRRAFSEWSRAIHRRRGGGHRAPWRPPLPLRPSLRRAAGASWSQPASRPPAAARRRVRPSRPERDRAPVARLSGPLRRGPRPGSRPALPRPPNDAAHRPCPPQRGAQRAPRPPPEAAGLSCVRSTAGAGRTRPAPRARRPLPIGAAPPLRHTLFPRPSDGQAHPRRGGTWYAPLPSRAGARDELCAPFHNRAKTGPGPPTGVIPARSFFDSDVI
jgi:hypothetical protein